MQYDILIIGSGPGGYKAAVTAAFMGAKVALIEKHLPGGNCLNQGCVPTKTLVHLAELLEDVSALQSHGILGQVRGDFGAAFLHKDQIIQNIRKNFPVWLKRLGVHLFQGQASFVDRNTVRIADPKPGGLEQDIGARRIIIATGSKPIAHPQCAIDKEYVLDSEAFMANLNQAPGSLLCVGGGAIGAELGYVMHQFGSKVTVVEASNRLLANNTSVPERASATLERKFRSLGIEVIKNCSVANSEINTAAVDITFTDGRKQRFDKVLVAIGRQPFTTDLALENAGVRLDKDGFIITNQFLETTAGGIYAIGDVKRGPMTANAALHDAKIAASNAYSGNKLAHNYYQVPTVIQSAMQIAAVGLNEAQADDAGFEPDTARANFAASVKALTQHETEGYTDITHDEETGQLLGGCIVGREAGENIQMLTAAVQSDRGLWFFSDINYSHPSWCEELENAINPFTSEFSWSGTDVFQPGIYAKPKSV